MLELIIMALATYRLSLMLTSDHGPGGVFDWLRYRFGYRATSTPYPGTLADGITCMRCTSLWMGILVSALFAFFGDYSLSVLVPLALSGFVAIVQGN